MYSQQIENSNDSLSESFFSRESLLIDTNYNQDFYILEEMGYNKIMIKKVYAFLKPNSLEQAINYMTEENGIYFHNFYKDYKHKKKGCYICGKPKENHSDYTLDENEEEDIIDEKNDETLLKTGNDFICNICGEHFIKNNKNVIKNLKCGDEYCNHCWFSYLRTKIDEGYVDKIKCMNYNCKEILNDKFIRNIIRDNKILYDKYEKFLEKNEILNNPNKKFCPIKGCDSYGEKKGNDKYIKCKKGHKFCFICMKNWHGKDKCEKKEEEDFKIWKKGKIIKQCPNCKMWTEKNEGCNHMTCAECKFQWCWLCGGKYTSNHFYEGKCNGLQFYKPKSEEDIKRVLHQHDTNNNRRIINNNNRLIGNRRQSQGLIPFENNNRNNSIDPNRSLRSFNQLSFFWRFCYILQYLLIGFDYIGYRCYVGVNIDNCLYRYTYCYMLSCFTFVFFVPMFLIMFIPMIPCIFYYPLFEKVWAYYWINVVKNEGFFVDFY